DTAINDVHPTHPIRGEHVPVRVAGRRRGVCRGGQIVEVPITVLPIQLVNVIVGTAINDVHPTHPIRGEHVPVRVAGRRRGVCRGGQIVEVPITVLPIQLVNVIVGTAINDVHPTHPIRGEHVPVRVAGRRRGVCRGGQIVEVPITVLPIQLVNVIVGTAINDVHPTHPIRGEHVPVRIAGRRRRVCRCRQIVDVPSTILPIQLVNVIVDTAINDVHPTHPIRGEHVPVRIASRRRGVCRGGQIIDAP